MGVHINDKNAKTLMAHWSPNAANMKGLNSGNAHAKTDRSTTVAAMALAEYIV